VLSVLWFMTSGNPFFMTSGNPFSVFKHFLSQWNQMTTYLLTNDWDELTSENDVQSYVGTYMNMLHISPQKIS
jgi:hypothetical protein